MSQGNRSSAEDITAKNTATTKTKKSNPSRTKGGNMDT